MPEKGRSFGWFWFLALVIAVGVLVNSVKNGTHKSSDVSPAGSAVAATPAAPDDSLLMKRVSRGMQTAAVFNNSKREVVFFLWTSWIPGETREGVMRYQVRAYLGDTTKPATDSLFLRRVQLQCRISAELTDNQDFQLRSFPLQFLAMQDDDHNTTSLEANDSVAMSKTEYSSISQANPAWSPTWRCY